MTTPIDTRPTLLFDLDGTLCECGVYYVEATEAFVRYQVERTGLAEAVVREVVEQVDLAATMLPDAFRRDRFPRSFYAASLALDALAADRLMPITYEAQEEVDRQLLALEMMGATIVYPERVEVHPGCQPDVAAAQESFRLADAVFDAPYELFPGVRETLMLYGSQGWQLLLLTKGDKAVQERKIKINDLDPLFHGVVVTPEKSVELLDWYLTQAAADRTRTWVIGDSMRDDMGPALALGLGAIHVTRGGSTWAYDNQTHMPHAAIAMVAELGPVLPLDPTHPLAVVANNPLLTSLTR
jgi:FMN phosphatase YigB (HAD superfamily)